MRIQSVPCRLKKNGFLIGIHGQAASQAGFLRYPPTKCPEFRKFEIEILDNDDEIQYFLIYGKGMLID
jgi:hypothetical protein